MKQIFKNIQIIFIAFKYLNFNKLKNFVRIAFSYLLSRNRPLFYNRIRPFFLSVEPADFCQLECPECPVGESKRKQGTTFDAVLFEKTIDQLKSTLFHLIFYFQGEPLLHKKLPEMIAYAHRAGIFTSTSTNAQLLNSAYAKALVQSGLDKLIVSVDGTSQDVYQQYRRGGKLELVIQGVEWVNHWKKTLGTYTPFIEIQMVVFKTNEHQMNEMKLLAKKLHADRLVFKSAQLYNFENGHKLLTTIAKYARYKKLPNGKFALKHKLRNRCFRLWSGAVITSRGQVLPCCYDKDASHAFGTVTNTGFDTIFRSDNAENFRNSILSNRKQHEMCRNCTSN